LQHIDFFTILFLDEIVKIRTVIIFFY
jgi:hypothetical protein